MEHRFQISVTAKQVESVFFKDSAFDVFQSLATLRVRRGFLWVVGGGLAFILFTYDMPNSGTFISLAFTAIIGQTILLGLAFHKLNKQRQQIADFARSTEQGGPAELSITNLGFSLAFKNAEHIERWSQVLNSTLAEDHIIVHTLTMYIFPKASMTEGDFETLTKLVKNFTLVGQPEVMQPDEKRPIGF